MPKLVVAGCSFSDRTLVEECYGDHLSKLLNIDYLHLAGGCGSNDRSMRLIVTNVLLNKINENDHVIIQLTSPERKEVFSNYLTHTRIGKTTFDHSVFITQQETPVESNPNIKAIHPWDSMPLNDLVDNTVKDFRWGRFKMHSWTWQENKTKVVASVSEPNNAPNTTSSISTQSCHRTPLRASFVTSKRSILFTKSSNHR